MQRMTLLCAGKLKTQWIAEGCNDYVRRIKNALSLMVYELPASKFTEPARQRDDESGRLLDTAKKFRGEVWVLDETGEAMTSQEFANVLGQMRDRGEEIVFIIGGAYGLTDSVRKAGRRVVRLSDMTLTHEMCRLVFLEQLYRAGEINRGSGYHH
jgi:23S rRNA (pseudouridine1915-N3)-methyltransferase